MVAPRLGRRPNEGSLGAPDEPFAFDAREFLRKKLIGETVTFIRDYSTLSGRDYGRVYLGGTSAFLPRIFHIALQTLKMLKILLRRVFMLVGSK